MRASLSYTHDRMITWKDALALWWAGTLPWSPINNRLQPDTAYAQYLPIMSFAGGKNYIHGFSGGTRSTTAMPIDLSTVSPGLGM